MISRSVSSTNKFNERFENIECFDSCICLQMLLSLSLAEYLGLHNVPYNTLHYLHPPGPQNCALKEL
jgi:hypothetical protein